MLVKCMSYQSIDTPHMSIFFLYNSTSNWTQIPRSDLTGTKQRGTVIFLSRLPVILLMQYVVSLHQHTVESWLRTRYHMSTYMCDHLDTHNMVRTPKSSTIKTEQIYPMLCANLQRYVNQARLIFFFRYSKLCIMICVKLNAQMYTKAQGISSLIFCYILLAIKSTDM